MTSPADVAAFHADYDHHSDDRVRLFATLSDFLPHDATVLYPGSYVDIGPSVWFNDVTYVDTDKRAARFFAQTDAVATLIDTKRVAAANTTQGAVKTTFHQLDYSNEIPIDDGTIGVLVSMYAGFITEHCSRYLRPGGHIVTNNSHGDASMASLDPDNQLVAVVTSSDDTYQLRDRDLDSYLTPKRGTPPTKGELHRISRGISYTKPASVYVFQHRSRN